MSLSWSIGLHDLVSFVSLSQPCPRKPNKQLADSRTEKTLWPQSLYNQNVSLPLNVWFCFSPTNPFYFVPTILYLGPAIEPCRKVTTMNFAWLLDEPQALLFRSCHVRSTQFSVMIINDFTQGGDACCFWETASMLDAARLATVEAIFSRLGH